MKLSILIPCYRVEQFIRSSLDNIFTANLAKEEYEVICFDDCSPDKTPQILDEYASMHTNMTVIHSKENIGPGGGRNRALKNAKGQYVWFVDADDKIVTSEIETLIELAEKNIVDVLIFDFAESDNNQNIIKEKNGMKDSQVMNGREFGKTAFLGRLVNDLGYPWRCLISREFALKKDILFPERMTYGEDTVWFAKVVLLAERIMSSSKCAYIYWHRESSTCGQMANSYPGKTIYERCIMTPSQIIEFCKELDSQQDIAKQQYAKELYHYAISHYINALPIMFGRMKRSERNVFYKFWSEKKYGIDKGANSLTKAMLTPCIGKIISDLFSCYYKATHKSK